MTMPVVPPVFLIGDGECEAFASIDALALGVEGVDLVNGDYRAFDASGRVVNLIATGVTQRRFSVDVGQVSAAPSAPAEVAPGELADALRGWLERGDPDRSAPHVSWIQRADLPELIGRFVSLWPYETVVVRDTRPLQAVMIGYPGALLIYWSISGQGLIWVAALLVWTGSTIAGYRWERHRTVASAEGISGLRLPVARARPKGWFVRRQVVTSVTPWSEIDRVHVRSGIPYAALRVRLTDGREADLPASAITRRGLSRLAAQLERLRPTEG